MSSIAVFLLLLEAVFNFLPVTDSPLLQPVTHNARVPHFKPNRDITWSKGWNFSIVNRRHINNYGFSDDQDYDPNSDQPLLAVVGDSYVESWMVPYEASIQGRLAAGAAGRVRVYSLAVSGAQLSTYLVFAKYARDVFRPAAMIVVIVGNDFDENFLDDKAAAKLTYFKEDDNGDLKLVTVPYNITPLKRVLRKSALIRYLFLNMELKGAIANGLKYLDNAERPVFVANTLAEPSPERLRASRRAVDMFLARLPEAANLPSKQIVFVVDGIRRQIYGELTRETVEASFVHQMRSYFMIAARSLGYEVIDMHAMFEDHFRSNGQRFEYPTDGHWNTLGHGVAAQAVRDSRVFSNINRL